MFEHMHGDTLASALKRSVEAMPWPIWVATPARDEVGNDVAACDGVSLWTNAPLDALMRTADIASTSAELRSLSRVAEGIEPLVATILIGETRYRPTVQHAHGPDGDWACIGWLTPLTGDTTHSPDELIETLTRRSLVFDQRTGLTVRATTERELRSEISRSRRYGNPLSVLTVEIGGDDVEDVTPALVAVSRTLKDNLRWVDILGAWDARTVVVILPETDADSARQLAGKLAEPLAAVAADCGTPTLATGAAQWTAADQPDDLIARARGELSSTRVVGDGA